MSTPTRERSAGKTVLHSGTVIAVCFSAELINGVGKEPRAEASITRWGIPGDRHYGKTRVSGSSGKVVPNNRPVTVVGMEAARDACERLGAPEIPPGGLGENILLEGAGDLADMVPGDQIRVLAPAGQDPSVVLQVRKQNEPCSNLQVYHRQMTK